MNNARVLMLIQKIIKLYQSYAKDITESGQLGIAKQLYEAMKRDQNT